ncbi:hypothetical protein [uncultured Sphingomonas sp.]|uniref:hypothetical protein n=1 Tax=uncultured Sphingomonas sp. TaxID=158754 RepID=UPI00261B4C2D|nr:hypothetical protein [uncultured Sphingomonas sp.]
MGFLNDEDYDDLPANKESAFLRLDSIARERLEAMAPRDGDGDILWRSLGEYMNEVTAIATHFGIPDIGWDRTKKDYTQEFIDFTHKTDYQKTLMRLRRVDSLSPGAITMTGPARIKLHALLEGIKDEVNSSALPERQRKRLLGIIADFEAELAKPRVDMRKALLMIMAVTNLITGVDDALIKTPKAIHAITSTLHELHADDDDKRQAQLPGPSPQKQIPDLRLINGADVSEV